MNFLKDVPVIYVHFVAGIIVTIASEKNREHSFRTRPLYFTLKYTFFSPSLW